MLKPPNPRILQNLKAKMGIPRRSTLRRFVLTAAAMYGVHPAEDAVQAYLGWNHQVALCVVCAVVFPLLCALTCEFTHSKRFH